MQAVCRFFYRRKYMQILLIVGAERSENRPMRLLRASCFLPFNTMLADGHKGPKATSAHCRLSVNLRYLQCLRVEYTSHAEPTDYTDILFSPRQSTEDLFMKNLNTITICTV